VLEALPLASSTLTLTSLSAMSLAAPSAADDTTGPPITSPRLSSSANAAALHAIALQTCAGTPVGVLEGRECRTVMHRPAAALINAMAMPERAQAVHRTAACAAMQEGKAAACAACPVTCSAVWEFSRVKAYVFS
jgi:hypothetical protein